MCLFPRLLKNPKYKPNKKNNGNVPVPKDVRALYVPIGCEKCIECRKQKSRAWQVRLLEDVRHNNNGKFITLTFSNEAYKKWYKEVNPRLLITNKGEIEEATRTPYEIDNMIATMAIRNFLERWRRKYGKSLRHWLVTELGHEGTENIHLHGIIWCGEVKTKIKGIKKRVVDRSERGILNAVRNTWNNGFVWIGEDPYTKKIKNYVNEETVNYITKYVSKMDEIHKYYNSIVLTSPGIGKGYTTRHDATLNKYNGTNTKEYYRNRQGYKINLPIYYRNKIYTEEQREQLWLQRLDKGERWVRGIKCTTDREYWDQLAEARKINKMLNYQGAEIDWKRKYYEEQIRLIKQAARINKKPYIDEELVQEAKTLIPETAFKTPSAGSNQKGLDYILRPIKEINTGELEARNKQTWRRMGVAPAVGCQILWNNISIIDQAIQKKWIEGTIPEGKSEW